MNQPTLENDRDAIANFIQAQLRGLEMREGTLVAQATGQAVSSAFQRLAEAAGAPVVVPESETEK